MVEQTKADIFRVLAEIEREDKNRQKAIESVLFLSTYFNIDANKLMDSIKKLV